MIKFPVKLALSLAGAAVIAGCGNPLSVHVAGSSSTTAAAEPGVDTYLCQGTTWDDLLQWRPCG